MQATKPMAAVYDSLYKSLEEAIFFLVFEADMDRSQRDSRKTGA